MAHTPTGSILLDRGPLRSGTAFRNPETLIEVWHPKDVRTGFEQLEAAKARGKWLAGSVSYEMGYALLPKLDPKMPAHRSEPLMRFGVFDGPETPGDPTPLSNAKLGPFIPDWDLERYGHAFEVVQGFISSGDFYQANLTFPLRAELIGSPYRVYDALRRRQPVPFGAFVDLGGHTLLSRSPELFFALSKDGQLRARPMKGTIRRDDDPQEDARLKQQLAGSEKDQAENLMITDLLRNDLGRISTIGSVHVPKLFAIESYSTLHQMVSEVVSQIEPGLSLFDIFSALFPCGSITGAPKIRAMEILSEIEDTPRGSYCGSIGWIAPNGSMEFNVAIRTLIYDPSGQMTLNVGGGVVYDSTAQSEYEEAQLKARFASNLQLS